MGELVYDDGQATIYQGDARHMAELVDESVQVVVTSPPYYGLRRYSGEQDMVFGGREGCEHEWGDKITRRDRGTLHGANAQAGNTLLGVSGIETQQGQFCSLCNAWKGSLGLEPQPELFIQHLIEILREVRRVLKPDGIVWLNIGDSYAGSGGAHKEYHANPGLSKSFERHGVPHWGDLGTPGRYLAPSGMKPKDLCLIPQRLAIACQQEGWWVRSIPIWHKTSPMPESVNGWRWEQHRVTKCPSCGALSSFKKRTCQKCGWQKGTRSTESSRVGGQQPGNTMQRDHDGPDAFKSDTEYVDCPGCPKCELNGGYILRKGSWRPTDSHEFILMLTKSEEYFADGEPVREKYTEPMNRWGGDKLVAKGQSAWDEATGQTAYRDRDMRPNPAGRNLRSVWTFPATSYSGPHFSAFPEKLPEICLLASTSERGNCPNCGKPFVRVIEKSWQHQEQSAKAKALDVVDSPMYRGGHHQDGLPYQGKRETIAWRATCDCGESPIPALILDPFMGTGTTLAVAKKLGRQSVGYDLSGAYCRLAVERNRQMGLF